MVRTLPRGNAVRVTFFECKVASSVLKRESATFGNSESSETGVIRLDVGAGVAILIGSCEQDGVGRGDR